MSQLRNVRKEPRATNRLRPLSSYSRVVAHRKNLNQKQLDVLQWVAECCPDGVIEEPAHRIAPLRSVDEASCKHVGGAIHGQPRSRRRVASTSKAPPSQTQFRPVSRTFPWWNSSSAM